MHNNDSDLVIKLNELKFRWPKSNIEILDITEMHVKAGQHLFIQGASGSGKSTLLNILSGVLNPQQGKVNILGTHLQSLSQAEKDRFRAQNMGIVFQQFNLLPYLSAYENIELALNVSSAKAKHSPKEMQASILHLMQQLGLSQTIAKQSANTLSIGQQQRVAVARALISNPPLLIVDEPTSALDSASRDRFMQQLFKVSNAANSTIIFVSHDQSLQTYFDHHCQLSDINQADSARSLQD